jgi:hypothetical protein
VPVLNRGLFYEFLREVRNDLSVQERVWSGFESGHEVVGFMDGWNNFCGNNS